MKHPSIDRVPTLSEVLRCKKSEASPVICIRRRSFFCGINGILFTFFCGSMNLPYGPFLSLYR